MAEVLRPTKNGAVHWLSFGVIVINMAENEQFLTPLNKMLFFGKFQSTVAHVY